MQEDPSLISLTLNSRVDFPTLYIDVIHTHEKNNIKSGKNCALRHHANNFTTTERDPE